MTILEHVVAMFPPWVDDVTAYQFIGVWLGGVLLIMFPPWSRKARKKIVS